MLAPWYRRWLGRIFLAIGALLVSLSLVAVWTSDIIGDTDRYVDTVSPVIEDPDVQQALAVRLTDEIVAAIKPDQLIESLVDELTQALSGRPLLSTGVQALVAPLSGAFHDFVLQRVEAVVSSPEFATAWDTANRAAHRTMVAALTGKDEGIVTNTEGTVSLDVTALAQVVVDDLVDRGFALAGKIPLPEKSFTIFQSEQLAKAQDAFRILDATALVLPWLALLFLVAAVLLAWDRRRAVAHAGLAIVAGALLVGVALVFGRSTYLSSWTDAGYNADVGATLFDSLVHFLRIANRAAIVLGLIIAAVALLTGPGRAATTVRRTVTGANAKAAPFVNDDFAAWVGRNRRPILVGVGVAALLWFVALDHPTPGLVLLIAIVAAVAYVAVGVVGTVPEPELELDPEPEPEVPAP